MGRDAVLFTDRHNELQRHMELVVFLGAAIFVA